MNWITSTCVSACEWHDTPNDSTFECDLCAKECLACNGSTKHDCVDPMTRQGFPFTFKTSSRDFCCLEDHYIQRNESSVSPHIDVIKDARCSGDTFSCVNDCGAGMYGDL